MFVIRAVRRIWGALPRGLRWGICIAGVLTILAVVRVWTVVAYSNEPYREEIEADLAAWDAAQRLRQARAVEVGKTADRVPAVLFVGKLGGALSEVINGRDVAGEVEDGLSFFTSFETAEWSAEERKILTHLRDTEDPAAAFYALVLAGGEWLAEPASAEQAFYLRYSGSVPMGQSWRQVEQGYIAVAAAHAERGDGAIATEALIRLLEVRAAAPRPVAPESYMWSPFGLVDIETVLAKAAVRYVPTEEQLERHERAWDALMAEEPFYEAIRIGTALQVRDTDEMNVTQKVAYGFNIYAFGKDFESYEKGIVPAPYTLNGLAEGLIGLQNTAAQCRGVRDWAETGHQWFQLVLALRRYERDEGRLPQTLDELTATLPDPAVLAGVDIERAGGDWVIKGRAMWGRPARYITVSPVAGGPVSKPMGKTEQP